MKTQTRENRLLKSRNTQSDRFRQQSKPMTQQEHSHVKRSGGIVSDRNTNRGCKDRNCCLCREVQIYQHGYTETDRVRQPRNHPVSERKEQMLQEGPSLEAFPTAECVVSAERLMPASQSPLKSLLWSIIPSTGTQAGESG